MQKLQFERAWDKTISKKDRLALEQLFQETVEQRETLIDCHVYRRAINHKREMLITVLIHNFSHQALVFNNYQVQCLFDGGQVMQNFTIPSLCIPVNTSMPWTFIFKDRSQFINANLLKVKIGL